MGIFRQFPYSNFHEMNLDWFLKKFKELIGDFDNLKEDYENYKIATIKYINEFVNEWLDKHPEITQPEAYDSLLRGNTYTPIYMGDFVESYEIVPSSFAIVNNILYILCWKRHSVNGEGKVIRVNIETNKILDTFETYLCHCNSCASVPGRNAYYIAKSQLSDVNGDIIRVNGIIKYNADFTEYTEIGMDQPWLGVSYDEITDKLYAYEIDGSLYEINENDEFNLIGRINIPNITDYNQDIAINNNVLLLSSYTGDVLKTNINNLELYEYGFIDHIDGTNRYIFDENEGWEFVNGELWCVQFSKHRTVQTYGFMSKIVTGVTSAKVPVGYSNIAGSYFTAEIKASKANNFAMFEHEFKHPNQLNTCPITYNSLSIDNDTNFGDVYITNSMTILHSLVCDNLEIRTSDVYFSASLNDVVEIGNINVSYRGSKITFAGDTGFVYTINNITYGYSGSEIVIRRKITVTPYALDAGLVTPLPVTVSAFYNDLVIPPIFHNVTDVNIAITAHSYQTITITVPKICTLASRFIFECGEWGVVGSISRGTVGNNWECIVTIMNERNTDVNITAFRMIELVSPYQVTESQA